MCCSKEHGDHQHADGAPVYPADETRYCRCLGVGKGHLAADRNPGEHGKCCGQATGPDGLCDRCRDHECNPLPVAEVVKQRITDANSGLAWLGVNADEAADLVATIDRLQGDLTEAHRQRAIADDATAAAKRVLDSRTTILRGRAEHAEADAVRLAAVIHAIAKRHTEVGVLIHGAQIEARVPTSGSDDPTAKGLRAWRAADSLAAVIATLTGADIGDHIDGNDPWANAIEAGQARISSDVEGIVREFGGPAVEPADDGVTAGPGRENTFPPFIAMTGI